MNVLKTILFVGLISFVNFAFFVMPNKENVSKNALAIQALNQELSTIYEDGDAIVYLNEKGESIVNPDQATLENLAPTLLEQNRIRVTLMGRSDNDLCSTELVIKNEEGNIIGNYSINDCSSYGWIFFTHSDCFEVALFHDAGLEAPYGNSVNGSVDWTFKFNDKSEISGTYMDMGAANMFKVASPCYKANNEPIISASQAIKKMEGRNTQLGI